MLVRSQKGVRDTARKAQTTGSIPYRAIITLGKLQTVAVAAFAQQLARFIRGIGMDEASRDDLADLVQPHRGWPLMAILA